MLYKPILYHCNPRLNARQKLTAIDDCVHQSAGSSKGLIDCDIRVVGLDSPAWVCDVCALRENPNGHRLGRKMETARASMPPPSPRQLRWEDNRRRRGTGAKSNRAVIQDRCEWRGEQTGQVQCSSCGGHVMIKVFECDKHSRCTLIKAVNDIKCCGYCDDYSAGRVG